MIEHVTKPQQQEVAINCEKAQTRYMAMSDKDALIQFSYELQGYVASQIERGMTLPATLLKVTKLVDMFAKVNAYRRETDD